MENTPTNRKEPLLHQKKPRFLVAIIILACMRYDAKTGWMFAVLLLGICELSDAVWPLHPFALVFCFVDSWLLRF